MAAGLHVVGAIVEIFTWVGFGVGVVLGILSLVWLVIDGSWHPVRALIERDSDGVVARWFADTGVGNARLTSVQAVELGDADEEDLFARVGRLDRVRLTRRPPTLRALGWAALAFLALGMVAGATQLVLLFAEG